MMHMHVLESVEYIIYNEEIVRVLSHFPRQMTFVCFSLLWWTRKSLRAGFMFFSGKVHSPTPLGCHHLKEQASHFIPVIFPSLRVSSTVSAT